MKKLIIIFITVISFIGITGVVYAETGISEIHFSARVPENFDRDINILLEFEDTNTGLFTLKVSNGYQLDSVIQTGKAKLKQIDIIGNIGQYEVTAPEEITIKNEEQANFNITVKEVELENIGEKIEDEAEIETKINTNLKEDTSNKDKDNIEIKNDKVEKKNNNTKDIKVRLIKNVFSTAIILIVVLAVYLIIKYKKEN